MLKGKSLVQLAADLTAGTIATDAIKDELGEGVLNSVLALTGGLVVAGGVAGILDYVNKETGIIDDLGDVVDDIFSIF